MLTVTAAAQSSFSLFGVVTDVNEEALSGATIIIHPLQKGTSTNELGEFQFTKLPKGLYSVTVSYVGFNSVEDSVFIDRDTEYNIQLEPTELLLEEVLVSYNLAEEAKREQTLNVEVVNEQFLKENLGGSLMKSLDRLPGVSTIDIGSGHSKPVIRGLGFNRVVVVENGIKHEGQQWGADHGLEIDQYAIDHLEVIKGPASLQYGSDAIAGVVHVQQNKVPEKYSLTGRADLTGKTNNNLIGASFLIEGRKDWLYGKLQTTILDYGDYRVPTDSVDIYSFRAPLSNQLLRNTAGYDRNFHLGLGILKSGFHSKFYVSSINSKSGFFANAHGLEPRNVNTDLHDASSRDNYYPYQKVNHTKVINTSSWVTGDLRLTSNLGFQHNLREEHSEYVSHGFMPPMFPDTMSFDSDLERGFEKYIYSGNLEAEYDLSGNTSITGGLNSEFQNNKIDGFGFIIPAFKQFTMGAFAIAKRSVSERSILQFGLRFDHGNISIKEYYDWFQSPVNDEGTETEYLLRAQALDRNFSNFSWSLGYNINPDHWLIKMNVGKSFRMPIAKELAANGVNYHHFSYEVGDPDLSAEESYQLDAGLEYSRDKFTVGVTPFLNYFPNYIYLNPTPEHDRLYGNGNQVYEYTQSEVFRYGGEIHSHFQVTQNWQLGFMGEYVYSKQLSGIKKGFTLPFSPPASALLNMKFVQPAFRSLQNLYASIDLKLVASQTNIVPPEEPTDGYTSVNLGLGGEIPFGKQAISVTMQIQNVLNEKYFNHTSYYRLINVPEPGRNFVLNITIPFKSEL